eukprot:TRINITY_DN65493_c0_g1_i1.p2 TRINITY_DN65493_c0_g1~~TRINITY_DN65493_c0_g1_i1.p2  ORF type:complete len:427 (+),score=138.99 TRINITY_DN65493_c0_g1_i1:165-1445(+)
MDWRIEEHHLEGSIASNDGSVPLAEGLAVIAVGIAVCVKSTSQRSIRSREVFMSSRRRLQHLLLDPEHLGPARGLKRGPRRFLRVHSTVNTSGMIPLGDGLHAPTYKASYEGRDVTVKMTQFNRPDPFIAEVLCLEAVKGHRGVVPIEGVCMAYPRDMIVVYGYADGLPLHNYCKQRRVQNQPIPVRLQWCIGVEVAKALRHCHNKGVLHRDLKSMNVIVKTEQVGLREEVRRVTLIDFGSAKLMKDAEEDDEADWWELWGGMAEKRLPLMTHGVGTFDWVAPEVWRAEGCGGGGSGSGTPGGSYSYPADVYSFGMIMFELATLHLPWSAHCPPDEASYYNSLKQDIMDGHRPLLPSALHPFTALLIQKCWHPDPQSRPTISDVVRLLEEAPWDDIANEIESTYNTGDVAAEFHLRSVLPPKVIAV